MRSLRTLFTKSEMLLRIISTSKGYAMTIQVQHTLRRLIAIHGCSAMLVRHMGEGISLYSIGGVYYYRIRGDGTIL